MKLCFQERNYLTEQFQCLQKSDIQITRQIGKYQLNQACIVEETDRKKGSCTCTGLCFRLPSLYKGEAENDLVVRHSEYTESNLDCMGMDELLVGTC